MCNKSVLTNDDKLRRKCPNLHNFHETFGKILFIQLM